MNLHFHNFPHPHNRRNHWSYKGELILTNAYGLFAMHYKIDPEVYLKVILDRRLKTFFGECGPNADGTGYELRMAAFMEDVEPEKIFWHELTHLYQYHNNKIKDVVINQKRFVVYRHHRYVELPVESTAYYTQPWEAQAALVSGKLWAQYKDLCLTVRGRAV